MLNNNALKDLSSNAKKLDLGYSKVTDRGLSHLSEMKLHTLILRDCKIQGPGLVYLKSMKLNTLDISRTGVVDEGLKWLSGLHVKHLIIGGDCKIVNGMRHLKDMKYLESLEVRDTDFSKAVVVHLKQVKLSIPSFKKLKLTDCYDAQIGLLESLNFEKFTYGSTD